MAQTQAKETPRRKARVVLSSAASWLRSGPASLGFALALLTVRINGSEFGFAAAQEAVVAGVNQPWWTTFSFFLWTTSYFTLVIDIILLLTIGIWFERIVGSVSFVLVGLATAWAGSFFAVLLATAIESVTPDWAAALANQYIAGTSALLVGVAMAASVRLGKLWRRRIQLAVSVVLLVVLGFVGSIDTVAAIFAGLLGWVAGYTIWGTKRDRRQLAGVRNDGRTLVALVVASVAVGTLIALRSSEMVGVLASLRFSYGTDAVTPADLQQICGDGNLEDQCAYLAYVARASSSGPKLLALMPLVMQLILAWGLRGGRRAAMWGTIGLQALLASISLMHLLIVAIEVDGWEAASRVVGFTAEGEPTALLVMPILVPLSLITLVSFNRRLFTVKAVPGTYRRFWLRLTAIGFIFLILNVIIGLLGRNYFTPPASLSTLVGDFLVRLLPSSALFLLSPKLVLDEGAFSLFFKSFAATTALGVWIAAAILLAGALGQRALASSISRSEYKHIVRKTDAGTMAWITTWEGNRFWRSKKFEAAIAYRASGGVALTVSDPAAKPEDLPAVLEEFAGYCAEVDLVPAFYSVHTPVAAVADRWGWPRIQVAEETVLDLPDLAFKGKAFQDIRTALNRAKKEGIRPMWTTFEECPEPLLDQVRAISNQWVSEKELPEMGFTLGGFAELDDTEVRILLAVDEDDHVHGVTSWMPVYKDGAVVGWTLDFMRRLEDGFRPVMEYLIAEAALWAKEENYQVLSLSGAPLARAQKPQSETPAAANANGGATDSASSENEKSLFLDGSSIAALDVILEILGKGLEPVYGFRSLLRFKAKFRPRYEPVYLVIPDVATLPTVGLAVGRAYLPAMSAKDVGTLVKAVRGE